MAITNTDIPQLVFNKMSSAKYNELKEAGQLVDNEFYITPDITNIPDIDESTNDKILSNNGSNLIWKDEQVGYKQITNCITEIPQDIKLELNSDGSITLKAGSKYYVPNGFEGDGTTPYFNVITVSNDITNAKDGKSNDSMGIFANATGTQVYINQRTSLWASGPTESAPATGNVMYYDTTLNKCRLLSNGELAVDNLSLPLGIGTTIDTGETISIDQVFNGFGYIGSTIFALPGVKGLSPNGNDSLTGIKKNNIISIENILTYICPNITANVILDLYANKIGINSQAFDKPTTDLIFFDEINNYNYAALEISNDIWVGSARIENGKIVLFNPKHPISLIDKNDSSWIAQQVMPSNKYIDLTLGATATTYTAPANGWFIFDGQGPTWVDAAVMFQNGPYYGYCYQSRTHDKYTRFVVPVQKRAVLFLQYDSTVTNLIQFRFVYAQGEL